MSEAKGLLNKYSRLISLVVGVVAAVYLIVTHLGVFGNMLLVIVGFGMVVLIHEFGHFIVAKMSGIKVEAFSIGFSPILAGILRTEKGYRIRILPGFFPVEEDEDSDGSLATFTLGSSSKASDTEYRIGLIPVGGFVKMLGQEDAGTVEATDDPRSFTNKSVGSRAAVIVAGVTFNAISAVMVFMIVFLMGIRLMPAIVGGVIQDSPAARAGLRAGDEIIEISGETDDFDFINIGVAAALSDVDEPVTLKVKHEDGTVEEVTMVAETLVGMPMRLFGVMPPLNLLVTHTEDANELFERTGLLGGDRITAVGGRAVKTNWEFVEIIEQSFLPEVTVTAERVIEGTEQTELFDRQFGLSLNFENRSPESESELEHIFSMVPRLSLGFVEDGSALKKGDIILAIGDIENPTYKEMRDVTTEYENKDLAIKVQRVDADGIDETLTVSVKPKRENDRVVIGIVPFYDAGHAVVAQTIEAEGGPAKLDIPRGATVTAVDGVDVFSFHDVIAELRKKTGERVAIEYRLDEQVAGSVMLDVTSFENSVTVESVLTEYIPFGDLKKLYKASGPVDAIVIGSKKTVMFIAQSYVTLKRLLQGVVSPKLLMGPVGILKHSYDIVAQKPFVDYIYFLGLISACIAVMNLLPLLPFDGGVLVMLLIEKIKGSPLSEKIQGVATYAGIVFVGAFFLYVTFNDIARSFFQ